VVRGDIMTDIQKRAMALIKLAEAVDKARTRRRAVNGADQARRAMRELRKTCAALKPLRCCTCGAELEQKFLH
jgi:hypothetical protein